MKVFKDTTGREWTISLTLGTAMKVKSKLDIDLLQPEVGEPPLLTRLGTDEILLGEVLCSLLESQFEKNNCSEEDIRNSFDGQTTLNAQTAFYEELIDFFRSRGRRDRAQAVAAQKQVIERAVAAMEAKISEIDMDSLIDGALSGNSQESSD